MWRVRRSGRRGGRALKSDLYDYRHQGGGKNGYDDSNCREIRKGENWIVLELNPNRDGSLEDILPEYDQYLDEYVYGKIWSELSGQDRRVLAEMAGSGETKVKNIRERTGMSSGLFSVYRERLKRKGVLDTDRYGEIAFILPRFAEFVLMQMI